MTENFTELFLSPCVAQTDPELMMPLPLPPNSWDTHRAIHHWNRKAGNNHQGKCVRPGKGFVQRYFIRKGRQNHLLYEASYMHLNRFACTNVCSSHIGRSWEYVYRMIVGRIRSLVFWVGSRKLRAILVKNTCC